MAPIDEGQSDASSWDENKRLIDYRLNSVDRALDDIKKQLLYMDRRLTGHMAKTAAWAMIAGTIAAAVVTAVVEKFLR